MNILIIGGTVFLGRMLVRVLREHGHTLTLFNRGKYSKAEHYADVRTIHGDRQQDIHLLNGGQWDAVIDTCGYFPAQVRRSAEFLHTKTQRYIFVSTSSVYKDYDTPDINENHPCATTDAPEATEVHGENYGALKHLCEQEVLAQYGENATILRPGLIVGEHDTSDRFSYWVHRAAKGGDILAPHSPDVPVQFIDVRDLAEFIALLTEQGIGGVFNVTSPKNHYTMGMLLTTAAQVTATASTVHWASEDFLLAHNVQPWIGLPLWIPQDPQMVGFYTTNVTKALAAGLTLSPLEKTITSTHNWLQHQPHDYTLKTGITSEQEQELLALWKRELQS